MTTDDPARFGEPFRHLEARSRALHVRQGMDPASPSEPTENHVGGLVRRQEALDPQIPPSEAAASDGVQTDSVRYVAIELASGRSLETLVIRDGGHVYVGANYPEFKRWPHEVRRDPEIVLRVGRTLYPRRAIFVEDASRTVHLLAAINAKYGFDVSMGTGRIWFFRLDPR